jgi:hypothetical protein
MTKEQLPMWRVDNLIPLLLVLASFFVYLNRLTIVETNQVTMMVSQNEIKQTQKEILSEFRDWKKQAEARIGQAENDITMFRTIHGVK